MKSYKQHIQLQVKIVSKWGIKRLKAGKKFASSVEAIQDSIMNLINSYEEVPRSQDKRVALDPEFYFACIDQLKVQLRSLSSKIQKTLVEEGGDFTIQRFYYVDALNEIVVAQNKYRHYLAQKQSYSRSSGLNVEAQTQLLQQKLETLSQTIGRYDEARATLQKKVSEKAVQELYAKRDEYHKQKALESIAFKKMAYSYIGTLLSKTAESKGSEYKYSADQLRNMIRKIIINLQSKHPETIHNSIKNVSLNADNDRQFLCAWSMTVTIAKLWKAGLIKILNRDQLVELIEKLHADMDSTNSPHFEDYQVFVQGLVTTAA